MTLNCIICLPLSSVTLSPATLMMKFSQPSIVPLLWESFQTPCWPCKWTHYTELLLGVFCLMHAVISVCIPHMHQAKDKGMWFLFCSIASGWSSRRCSWRIRAPAWSIWLLRLRAVIMGRGRAVLGVMEGIRRQTAICPALRETIVCHQQVFPTQHVFDVCGNQCICV